MSVMETPRALVHDNEVLRLTEHRLHLDVSHHSVHLGLRVISEGLGLIPDDDPT